MATNQATNTKGNVMETEMTTATVKSTIETHCAECNAELPKPPHTGASGYGMRRDQGNKRFCYACCGKFEKKEMTETGRAFLYVVDRQDTSHAPDYVTDWPGTLRFRVTQWSKGRHNRAGTRLDVWFTGPDGKKWHGWRAGDNGNYIRCKRLKRQ